MVNYQNGKIYRLISVSGKQYVGSTTQNLAKRKAGHVNTYKAWLRNNKESCFTTSFTLLEEGEVEIVLIEEYPCQNKEQLQRRERYWIEMIDGGCVNKYIPTRTYKEYYEANKQQLLEYHKQYREENKDQFKQYREANKDKINEYHKQYYEQNKDQWKQYYEKSKDKLQRK